MVWFGGMQDYVWSSLRGTVFVGGNNVTILARPMVDVPEDLQGYVTVENATTFESPEIEELRRVYLYYGIGEPFERENLERFFLIKKYMEMNKALFSRVLYIDSDVVVRKRILRDEVLPPGCDVMVSFPTPTSRLQWDTTDWVVWSGSSVLSLEV